MFGPDKCGQSSKVHIGVCVCACIYVFIYLSLLLQIHFIIRFKNPITGDIEVPVRVCVFRCPSLLGWRDQIWQLKDLAFLVNVHVIFVYVSVSVCMVDLCSVT